MTSKNRLFSVTSRRIFALAFLVFMRRTLKEHFRRTGRKERTSNNSWRTAGGSSYTLPQRYASSAMTAATRRSSLRMLLTGKNRQATTVNPYSTLDQVYLDVLRAAISLNMGKEDVAHIRLVLGTIVVLQNPLPLTDFANLMKLLKSMFSRHSVIFIPSLSSQPTIPSI